MTKQLIRQFRKKIWGYYRTHGRGFPWRKTRDPYRILVSEIMLQQTQAGRVLKKYGPFLRRFPNFKSLAAAPTRSVLTAWQGMGYNRRALALKRIAEIVIQQHRGMLPSDPTALQTLPGVGAATAGAIAAFAFGKSAAFIETNIRRVFIHFFFPHKNNVRDAEILALAARTLDTRRPREWHYALMDYGAHLGKRLGGGTNPNRKSSRYRRQTAFKGSHRELRGKIISFLLHARTPTESAISARLEKPIAQIQRILAALHREGFIVRRGRRIRLVR